MPDVEHIMIESFALATNHMVRALIYGNRT